MIVIKPVVKVDDEAAMLWVRHQVFEREMGLTPIQLRLNDKPNALHLLARVGPEGDPVATLSVIETSDDHQLHKNYDLNFGLHTRAARYTQLAVLKPYRGMNLPMRLMLEAHSRFVVPHLFDYTWLLFDAERAASSILCKWMAFTIGDQIYPTEFGFHRTMVRKEATPYSTQTILRAEKYLNGSAYAGSL
jgi:hypothetical protein